MLSPVNKSQMVNKGAPKCNISRKTGIFMLLQSRENDITSNALKKNVTVSAKNSRQMGDYY